MGFLTSDDVLDLAKLPESIIVLGGGAIALELAHYYEALGVKTTIIQRSPQLLKLADADIGEILQQSLEEREIAVHTGTKLESVSMKDGRKCVRFTQGGIAREAMAEEILVATGRSPNSEGLHLTNADILTNKRGSIITDEYQATQQPHIFAAGDVSSPVEVVHIAITQGENAAHNAAIELGRNLTTSRKKTSYSLKLFGIFTEPEIGMIGLTEREATAQEIPFKVASYPFNDHGKSMVSGTKHGIVKLIAREDDGRLLGGAVIGPHGVELIHEIGVAMYFGGTVHQLAEIPHYHPTLSEIWTYPAEELAETCGNALA